jgi:hypothetical protein
MNRKVTILLEDRDSVAVAYIDDGIYHGRIVRVLQLSSRVDNTAYIDDESLQAGVEYGIDMEVLFSEPITITQRELQQALRQYGLWTDADMFANRGKLVEAMMSIAKKLAMEIISKLSKI